MAFFRPKRGLWLPGGTPAIDWTNQITDGLIACWVATGEVGNSFIRDYVSQSLLPAAGTPVIKSAAIGMQAIDASGSNWYGPTASSHKPTVAFSVLWFGTFYGGGNNSGVHPALFAMYPNNSNGSPFLGPGFCQTGVNTAIEFTYNNTSSFQQTSPSGLVSAGVPVCLLGSANLGGKEYVFKNGLLVSNVSALTGSAISYGATARTAIGAGSQGGGANAGGGMCLGLLWNRQLTLGESALISADPTNFLMFPQDYVRTIVGQTIIPSTPGVQISRIIGGTHRHTQLTEASGYQWLRAGPVGQNAAAPPQITTVITKQEQPTQPLPVVQSGMLGAAFSIPFTAARTTQELPVQPQPLATAGVQGRNVASPPQIGGIQTRQEQPPYYAPDLITGVQGPGVRSPIRDAVILAREQPDHPAPMVRAGIQGPDVRAPVRDVLLLVQQQPDHPPLLLKSGPFGQNVAAPWQIGAVFTRQEQPVQPPPAALSGVYTQPPVTTGPAVTSLVRTDQEQPAQPPPFAASGRQGPNVASSPQIGAVRTTQQQPDHPGPFTRQSVQGPGVRVPVQDRVILVQQQPEPGSAFVRQSTQGPNVRPVVRDYLVVIQQQPDHPAPWAKAGPQGPNVAALPQVGGVFTRQEQPPLFVPSVLPGIPGPNVASSIGSTFARQEQPAQPQPIVWAGTIGTPHPLSGVFANVQQQQPDHPRPFLLPTPLSAPRGPLLGGTIITAQEMPAQQPSPLWVSSGPAGVGLYARRWVVMNNDTREVVLAQDVREVTMLNEVREVTLPPDGTPPSQW